MNEYLALISTFTALVAVIVGPWVTYYIAKRQIAANTISANRQQWINTLRDELANYLGAMADTGVKSATQKTTEELFQKSFKELTRVESKVRLLLNPDESDHAQLAELLAEASRLSFVSNHPSPSEMAKIQNDLRMRIIPLSQKILKREWIRVKKLD